VALNVGASTEGINNMDVPVRRLNPDDWQAWRTARLAALAEAPYAFASSLEKERSYHEKDWRDWLDPSKGLKVVAGDTAGMVGAWIPEDRNGSVELYSMWTAPEWRRRGVGGLLIDEVLTWARENRHERVDLWVVDGNIAAKHLYLRHGFRGTDEYQRHPNDAQIVERVMTRDLN
jgi:ribosomal protein S18 acetylase RimI-like enzyme